MFQLQLCSAKEVVTCCSLAHSPVGWSLLVQVPGGLRQKVACQNRLLREFCLCILAQPILYKPSLYIPNDKKAPGNTSGFFDII